MELLTIPPTMSISAVRPSMARPMIPSRNESHVAAIPTRAATIVTPPTNAEKPREEGRLGIYRPRWKIVMSGVLLYSLLFSVAIQGLPRGVPTLDRAMTSIVYVEVLTKSVC